MKIRIIHYSNSDGSREGIYMTEDFDTAVEDFIPPGCTLDSETKHDIDLPGTFPLDYHLERTF